MVEISLQRRHIERDGDTIYYELAARSGDDDRPVVVLTHGAGGSHAVWFNQVLPLAERYRVLTWDSRGFGNSTCQGGEVSVAQAVADLTAVLDDAAIAAPVHLVGQSMGGWWVVGFALHHPGRVRSLVLSDTPGGVWTAALREHFGSSRTARNGLSSEVVGVHPALGKTTMARHPEQAFLYQQLGSFHQPPMRSVLQVLTETAVEAAAVSTLGIPLAIIAGEEDTIFPAAQLQELATLLAARYVELPGAGHSPYFESPDAYNEALLRVLG